MSNKTVPDQPGTTYGTVDNPAYLEWAQRRAVLDRQASSDPTWKNDPNGYAASLANLGPAPPQTVQVDTAQAANDRATAKGANAVNTLNASANRILNMAQGYTAPSPPPGPTVAQQLSAGAAAGARQPAAPGGAVQAPAALPSTNGATRSGLTQLGANPALSGSSNPAVLQQAQNVGAQIAGATRPLQQPGATKTPLPVGQAQAAGQPYAQAAQASSSPLLDNSAAARAEIGASVNQANAAAANVGNGTPNFAAQSAAAASRQAPQIQSSSAGQQQALSAVQGFRPDTSGISAIQNARADTSGVGAVAGFTPSNTLINQLSQFDASGTRGAANALEGFNPTDAQQGVQSLNSYSPVQARQGIADLKAFTPYDTELAALNLQGYNPQDTLNAAHDINGFQSTNTQGFDQSAARAAASGLQSFSGDRSGINALNAYANEAEGPSAAQALLQSGSDANLRQSLALARSARGGPAAIAQALRGAQSEGAATQAQTSGQAAALRAQEFNDFQTRRLGALQSSGQLISNADAQRLQAQVSAGGLLSEADAQKLSQFQSMDAQRLQAQVASGQLISAADAQKLSAYQAAGQLSSAADAQKLSSIQTQAQLRSTQDQQKLQATLGAADLQGQISGQKLSALQSSGQLMSNVDAQRLGALSSAGGLQSNADAQRLSAAQSAASDLLQGSQINQQGAIAASNAQLTASGQQLQALSLQGQLSTEIRNADIDVLKANQSAALQQLNLNDTQVRQFAQIQEDARQANQTAQIQATQLGVNAQQAAQALDLQWETFAQSKLDTQQQVALQKQGLAQGLVINQNQTAAQERASNTQLIGTAALAFGTAVSDERAKKDIRPVSGRAIARDLRASPGATYRYKNEADGEGEHVGPMAQQLQRSQSFRGAVQQRPDGKLEVHGARLALAQHAALAHLQKEIDEIKKHRRPRKNA